MCQQNRFSARRASMCVTWCCLGWVTACASYVTPPVSIPAPLWVPCSLEAPPADLTVRAAELRLERAESALAMCDAQGRKVLGAWPK